MRAAFWSGERTSPPAPDSVGLRPNEATAVLALRYGIGRATVYAYLEARAT